MELAIASRTLGLVMIIKGDVAEVLVGRIWLASGSGDVGPFDAAIIVFFGMSHVGVAPVSGGVVCVNIIVPHHVWAAAVQSLPTINPPSN